MRFLVGIVLVVALFAIVVLGGVHTGGILIVLLGWVLPVFVGYQLTVSKERAAPLVLAVFLSWLGVIIALMLPTAGRRCPFCDETVRAHAVVCRHCGRDLSAAPVKPA